MNELNPNRGEDVYTSNSVENLSSALLKEPQADYLHELKKIQDSVKTLAENLELATQLNKDLWTIHDIALYCSVGKSTAQKMIDRPRFPRCIRLQTTDTGYGSKRWKASEVMDYVERWRQPPKLK